MKLRKTMTIEELSLHEPKVIARSDLTLYSVRDNEKERMYFFLRVGKDACRYIGAQRIEVEND